MWIIGQRLVCAGHIGPVCYFGVLRASLRTKLGQIMEIIAVALRLACKPYIPKDPVFLYCCLRSLRYPS